MKNQQEIRARLENVNSFTTAERERIYRKYFANPNATVRFLCNEYGLDQKRVLDVCCCYGYHLIHFGEGSCGIDGSPQYLRFASEIGLNVQTVNIDEEFPEFPQPFDALFFSGTLEEILSPHIALMRFRKLLKPDGLLCLRVPCVPPVWFDKLYRASGRMPGYDAPAHLYFFTPRLLQMTVERAGYKVLQIASTGMWMNKWLRPFHNLLLPLTPTATIVAQAMPEFEYPPVRAMRFLPEWAKDLAPYHQDYNNPQAESTPALDA